MGACAQAIDIEGDDLHGRQSWVALWKAGDASPFAGGGARRMGAGAGGAQTGGSPPNKKRRTEVNPMPNSPAEVRMLDSGYAREARSLLYHAYRHDPTFAYLFEADRPGYDQRVRATVRELVQQHFSEDLLAIGLLIDDRLIGMALIAPPQRRMDITESWNWRMRMLLTTGFRCTKRYLEYHDAVIACLPPGPYHVLPLLGVHPQYQGQHLGEQLLEALHNWCAEDTGSQGVVLDTGNSHYLDFYKRQGYQEIGEVAVGPIIEHVFFHPSPQPAIKASA